VTFGAPAAHELGFKKRGAKSALKNIKDSVKDLKKWLETGVLTPNLRYKDERARKNVLSTMTTQKASGVITVRTKNPIDFDIYGEPIRMQREHMEEVQAALYKLLDQIQRLVTGSNLISNRKFQQIEELRTSLSKHLKEFLKNSSEVEQQSQNDEENPQVLSEVIEASRFFLFHRFTFPPNSLPFIVSRIPLLLVLI